MRGTVNVNGVLREMDDKRLEIFMRYCASNFGFMEISLLVIMRSTIAPAIIVQPVFSIALNGNTAGRLMQGVLKEMSERRLRICGVPKGSLETDN